MFFGPTVGPPHTGASQSSACTLLTGDTGRRRCGPPPLGCWLGGRKTRRQRRVRVRNSARRGRQRYMAIQTLVFYPSLIGKLSTVNSALKLDIDPSTPPAPQPLPRSAPPPPLPLQLWDCTFSLLVIFSPFPQSFLLFHSYSLPLWGISSIGIFFLSLMCPCLLSILPVFFHLFPDPTRQWRKKKTTPVCSAKC